MLHCIFHTRLEKEKGVSHLSNANCFYYISAKASIILFVFLGKKQSAKNSNYCYLKLYTTKALIKIKPASSFLLITILDQANARTAKNNRHYFSYSLVSRNSILCFLSLLILLPQSHVIQTLSIGHCNLTQGVLFVKKPKAMSRRHQMDTVTHQYHASKDTER